MQGKRKYTGAYTVLIIGIVFSIWFLSRENGFAQGDDPCVGVRQELAAVKVAHSDAVRQLAAIKQGATKAVRAGIQIVEAFGDSALTADYNKAINRR